MTAPSVSTEEDSVLLEKILKDAEELAMKMTRQQQQQGGSEASVSTRSGDDASESPSSPPGIAGDIKNGSTSLASDNDTELEELLKQSETLLGKMRSKTQNNGATNGAEEQNSVSSPPESKVEPPKASPNAPTSVYIADFPGTDDLSSVGSNSLRSPMNTHASLRMPSYSSSTDPIQEEPLSPSPNSKQALPKQPIIAATNVPGTPVTNKDMGLGLNMGIPDFTVTSPNAKWEKVSSATNGDDDYVPLVDYSKLKKEGNATGALNTSTTTTSSNNSENNEGTVASAAPQSRVQAFRAQKRRLRKKRRRQMAVLILCATFLVGYYVFVRQPQQRLEMNDKDVAVDTLQDEDLEDIVADLKPLDDDCDVGFMNDDGNCVMEEFEEKEMLDSLQSMEGSFADVDEDAEDELVDHDAPVDESEVLDDESLEKNETFVAEPEGIKTVEDTESKQSIVEEEIPTSVQPDPLLVKRCKNIFRRIFNKKCRILARERRCENPLHKIFNRKCRALAREKKDPKSSIPGINLQAVAGI